MQLTLLPRVPLCDLDYSKQQEVLDELKTHAVQAPADRS